MVQESVSALCGFVFTKSSVLNLIESLKVSELFLHIFSRLWVHEMHVFWIDLRTQNWHEVEWEG